MELQTRVDAVLGGVFLLGSGAFALVELVGWPALLSDLLTVVLLAGAGVASLVASRTPDAAIGRLRVTSRTFRGLAFALLGLATIANQFL